MAQEVPIHGATIRLGQLLKLAGVVDSGSDVKALLTDAFVLVNGQPDARRGRQLHPGDSVRVSGVEDLGLGLSPDGEAVELLVVRQL